MGHVFMQNLLHLFLQILFLLPCFKLKALSWVALGQYQLFI